MEPGSWLCLPSPEISHFTAGRTPACKVHVFAKSRGYRNVSIAGGKTALLSQIITLALMKLRLAQALSGIGAPTALSHAACQRPRAGPSRTVTRRSRRGQHTALLRGLLCPSSPGTSPHPQETGRETKKHERADAGEGPTTLTTHMSRGLRHGRLDPRAPPWVGDPTYPFPKQVAFSPFSF